MVRISALESNVAVLSTFSKTSSVRIKKKFPLRKIHLKFLRFDNETVSEMYQSTLTPKLKRGFGQRKTRWNKRVECQGNYLEEN